MPEENSRMRGRFLRTAAGLFVCLAGLLVSATPALAQALAVPPDDVEQALEQVLGFEARRQFTLYQ